jgi:pimeloyl-ACP methyl ester carboxylesterase
MLTASATPSTRAAGSFAVDAAARLLRGATRRRIPLPGREMEIAVIEWPCSTTDDAPLALLHHANGFCAATWALFVEHLRPHYRVVALDARGHGDSTSPLPSVAYAWCEFADDLTALAEQLMKERGGQQIGLGMGNSFGGLVTAYVAAQRPELFARVAMLDPVLRPPVHLMEEMLAGLRGDSAGVGGNGLERAGGNPLSIAARKRRQVWPSREVAFEAWRTKPMFKGWAPGVLELYVGEGLRDRDDGQVELKCRGEVEASVFEANGVLDLYAVAGQLEAPTLLLRAGQGNFPMVLFETLAERIPDVRLLELDIDHLMPMHNPPELAEVLLEFALQD